MAKADDVPSIPNPENWNPSSNILTPSPLAMVDSPPGIPSPLIKYGEFSLDVHARIQTLLGMVGSDSHVKNGDLLSRDGFRIRRARLGVTGELIKHWEFELELDLIDEDSGGNALLDACVTYRPLELAWIQVGAGRLPYSRAAMTSSANLQFIERPVWVNLENATGSNLLDLNRQAGITLGGSLGLFNYAVGVYNGERGFSVGDINNGLLYLARLEAGQGKDWWEAEDDLTRQGLRWKIGLNGYINQAAAAEIRGAGSDLSLKFNGFSLYAEALWAKVVPNARPETDTNDAIDRFERFGMAIQAGYVHPFDFAKLGLAVRFCFLDDNVYVSNEGDLWELTVGFNAYLKEQHLKLMLNYVMKEELKGADLHNDAVLAMLQLMF